MPAPRQRQQPRRAANPAFTLLEVMLVIGIIGVAMVLLFSTVDSLFPDARKDSPYETLRKAVDAAWFGAATTHEQYVLEYDAEAKAILVHPLNETRAVQRFTFDPERVENLAFARLPDEGQGSLQSTSTLPFPRLLFSPWGGITPARIELSAHGEMFSYRLDPFGGALTRE